MSFYSEAIELTISTINKRASNHRNLVVVTCCIIAMALVASIASQTFTKLSVLAVLVPISGIFFHWDQIILQVWRSDILGKWSSGNISLILFKETLLRLPHLPAGTTSGMLSSLPACTAVSDNLELSIEDRLFLSKLILFIYTMRGKLILFRFAVYTAISGFAVVALYSRNWIPLLGCAVVFMYPLVKRTWIRREATRISADLSRACDTGNIESEQVLNCLKRYDLTPYREVKLSPFGLVYRD